MAPVRRTLPVGWFVPPVVGSVGPVTGAGAGVDAPSPRLTTAAAFWVTLPLPAAVLMVSEVALIAPSASALPSLIETAPPVAPTLAKSLPGRW